MGKIANDDDTAVAAMTVERNVRRDISVAAVVDVVSCRTVVDEEDIDIVLIRCRVNASTDKAASTNAAKPMRIKHIIFYYKHITYTQMYGYCEQSCDGGTFLLASDLKVTHSDVITI